MGELFMSENRELNMDDYLAMLRRRLKVILIPALVAPIVGFLVSYQLPPRYTAQSTVLVEGQKVPDTYVAPVITADFAERVQSLSEQIKSATLLRPMLANLGVKPEDVSRLVNQIQSNTDVQPVLTPMSAAVAATPAAKKKPSASNEPVPGFQLSYTDSDPTRAQGICNALTSLMLDQNLKSRAAVAKGTTDFLSSQLDDAKKTVDEQDAKLAAFKKQYMGQLPTDIDNNMRMLMSLNTQLDASTQTLSRAQQDKTYTEGMLAQQIAAWKSSLNSTNPQTLQQQLAALQSQLLQLQSRYTDDYPDVMKTKHDIAEIQKKLNDLNSADAATTATTAGTNSVAASEPPEIQQLRLQIHQYQEVIAQATQDQKKLQGAIVVYQGRTAMSPNIEEQYKDLTRDNDTAQAFYKDLLAKQKEAELGTSMESLQEGEQMHIAAPADLPDSPSFPNRPVLAGAGFGVGLAFGALIAIFLEFSDKSIRTERDAAVSTDLPLLISLPWLTAEEEDHANANGNGRRRFWGRSEAKEEHEKVGV
jgi:uncharacterized protein involved in exopolysaccharide biosynthesis